MTRRLLPDSDIQLSKWRPDTDEPWADQAVLVLASIDLHRAAISLLRYSNPSQTAPHDTGLLYLSYLMQVYRDFAGYLVSRAAMPDAVVAVNCVGIDWALGGLLPWRYTADAMAVLIHEWDDTKGLDGASIDVHISRVYSRGLLPSVDRVIARAHVLAELAYQVGWSNRFESPAALKAQIKVRGNPPRIWVLRDTTVTIAAQFSKSQWVEDARFILSLGFPDAREYLGSISDVVLSLLLQNTNTQSVINALTGSEAAQTLSAQLSDTVISGARRAMNVTGK